MLLLRLLLPGGFPMSDALPMPGEALPKEVDLQGGYLWK
jgi:hypothetical protein